MSERGELQYGYAARHAEVQYDSSGRRRKAEKALSILEDCLGNLSGLHALDLGCSTGLMSLEYASRLGVVIGTDIDQPALRHARENSRAPNLSFVLMDGQRMALPDECFDLVLCNHIYEHVPDSARLMAEIRRVLKPGGVCLFAAGNRIRLIEPHYRLPLLSLLPKALAHLYVRALGRGDSYYETHLTYWGLRRLTAGFEHTDYTARVIREPQRFCADDMIAPGSWQQRLALALVRCAYWSCPTYLWLLRKPVTRRGAAA